MYGTREEWLKALSQELEPIIHETTNLKPLPDRPYRIACGWPSRGGRALKNQVIGQCQVGGSVKGVQDIFISPTLDDPVTVAGVTVHEMLHAFLPPAAGHRKPFSQAMKRIGLVGKPTRTEVGEDLELRLKAITDKLGPYPHDRISVEGVPRDKGRMLKAICPICGYIVRTTAKWLDEVGAPICPQCHIEMTTDPDVEVQNPLVAVDQTVEYKLRDTERFMIRMIRTAKGVSWFVIDYEPEANGPKILASRVWDQEVVDLTPVDFFPPPARITPAESREDSLSLVEALTEGTMTYDDLETDDDLDADSGDGDPADDQEDLRFIDDDEDEGADYPDGLVDPKFEAAYANEQAKREAWVILDNA